VTIPNFITIGRLMMVPLIIWLIVSREPLTAFWCFVVAGISDGVDGFMARQFNMRSDLGTYLDPIADKALLVSIFIALAVLAEIPVWLTLLVVSRDFLIVGGVVLAWMLDRPIEMKPRVVSKVNTVAQIVLVGIVLADLAFVPDLSEFRYVTVLLVAALTVASTIVYMVDWVRHMGVATSGGPGPAQSSEKGKPS
jgi:cardiolipin synthase